MPASRARRRPPSFPPSPTDDWSPRRFYRTMLVAWRADAPFHQNRPLSSKEFWEASRQYVAAGCHRWHARLQVRRPRPAPLDFEARWPEVLPGEVLGALKTLQEAEAVVTGTPAPERVFSAPGGLPIHENAFRSQVWASLLRRAKIRYRKIHTLRHTFASLLLDAGEPLTYIQRQLGHHSPAFTLTVYGHLLPRGDRRAVDTLDDATIRNPRATSPEAAETPANVFQ